jgi:hypothetical protein
MAGMIRTLEVKAYRVELPPEVAQAFWKLGDSQRGAPEAAMLKVNHFHHGVLSDLVEHIGDLTWRMAKDAKDGYAGRVPVESKTSMAMRRLHIPSAFEREHEENIKNNAEYRKVDEQEYRNTLNTLLANYAKEHEKLVVYNKTQWMARECAFMLGKQRWYKASMWIEQVNKLASKSDEEWTKHAFEYTLGANGKPIPFV